MIKVYKLVVLPIIGLFLVGLSANAQTSGFKSGKLENGLSYYLMSAPDFNGEVNFYLYQNVGAVVEKDNQNGLAHFLEHMAFNASDHFPGGIMNFLKRNGINSFDARTGINETLYSIFNIPCNSPLADSMMFVLKDWCNGLMLRKEDVEKEKKIIIEEWRQRNDVNKRLSDSIAYPVYNYSEYSKRNIIGAENLIKNYKVKDIKEFYNEWYKPSLQCVAIVGDFDVAEYEERVKKLFNTIPVPHKVAARQNVEIKDNALPIYYQFVDKENSNNSFGIYQRIKLDPTLSQSAAAKNHILEMIFNKMALQELSIIRNNGTEEFIAATVNYSPLVRMYAQNAWDVVPYEGREKDALKQIMLVRETIRKVGFDDKRFETVKKEIYDDIKLLLENEKLGTPDNYMEIFKQNYLYGKPIVSFQEQLTVSLEELVELEIEDLNDWVASWMDDKNLSFITYSSDSRGINISPDDFLQILNEVKGGSLYAKGTVCESIANIVDFDIKPGDIVEKNNIESLDAQEWKLSNGATVLYKYLPEMKDGFYFVGSAVGGNSIIGSKDIPSYNAMKSLIMQSGIHKYNRNQLYEWIKDKEIELNINITDYTDGIGGYSSTRDAEDYFRYLYLVLTHQNFDKRIFEKYVERERYLYSTKDSTGMSACQDSIRSLLYPYSDLNPKIDKSYYNRMSYSDLSRLFNDKFGNASDFTFCFVGALPCEKAEDLISKYIASLPYDPSLQKRTYKIIDNSSSEKTIKREFVIETKDNVGEIELSFINDIKLSPKEEKSMLVLEDVLRNLFFAELREKYNGTYNIGVRINYENFPKEKVAFNIHFSTESDRVDELKQVAYDLIKNVADGKLADIDFKNSYAAMVIEEQKNKESVESMDSETSALDWLSLLNAYAEKDIIPLQGDEPEEPMSAVSKSDIIKLLNKILNGAKTRDIVIKSSFVPEIG